MPTSKNGVHVYRDAWAPEHLALLCGIANAGGGALIVSSAASSRAMGIGRLRKPFEKIPEIAQRELGIACITFPVLDGPLVRLEISIPASDPDHPTHLNGTYWFYDKISEKNLNLGLAGVKERRKGLMGAISAEQGTKEPSVAGSASTAQDVMQMFADMMSRLAGTVEGISVQQDGSTFVIDFPQDSGTQKTQTQDGLSNNAQDDVPRVGVQDLDFEANEFSQRSIAAANRMNLTSTDEYVLRVLHANGRATAPRIAELLGVSESTVRRSFKQLKEHALIERIGSTKAGYWHVLD